MAAGTAGRTGFRTDDTEYRRVAAPTSDRTVLQYSLRSLLVATAVVAVLSAIAAPFVRRLNPEQQLKLGLILAFNLLLAGLYFAFLCHNRWKVEKQGGRLLLRVHPLRDDEGFSYHARQAFVAAILLWTCHTELGQTLNAKGISPSQMAWTSFPIFVFSLIAVDYLVVMWWGRPPRTMEIRENAVYMNGVAFMPWSRVRAYRWGVDPFRLTLQLRYWVVNVDVQPGDKVRLNRLLAERVGTQAE